MDVWNNLLYPRDLCRRALWRRRGLFTFVLVVAMGVLSGCGFISGPERPQPAPIQEQRELVPTWTPTPVVVAPTPEPATPTPVPPTPLAVQEEPSADPQEATSAEAEVAPAPTDTPAPALARLTVTSEIANVRQGPGTHFGIVGTVDNAMAFDVLGKNPAGDWFQFCCVNGEQGWIFAQLVQVENAQLVAVAQNIPAPPPTHRPAAVAEAPAPANTPVPQPQPEPPPQPEPQPASDPCANIGGDGCKFKVTGGPRAQHNGGMELKLQLFFIHGGVDGGQPQGSYFIALEKDGQRLPLPDSVRSIALQRSEGPLGPYNYEYKMGPDRLPGNSVAGHYVGWVLDGNGERDSQNFSFNLADGEGEVWIQFDQN